jgi:hypothetical protein
MPGDAAVFASKRARASGLALDNASVDLTNQAGAASPAASRKSNAALLCDTVIALVSEAIRIAFALWGG